MCARATSPFARRGRTIDIVYKLKYDAPFVPFRIVTKNRKRYSISEEIFLIR
jgi:hypothetical protein